MDSLLILVPAALILGLLALAAFLWALRNGQYDDPDGAAASWSRILDRPAVDNIIRLDGSQIRFVPIVDGRGPGVSAYDVKVVDRDRVLAAAEKRGRRHGVGQVEVCGCRINLV